VAKPVASVFSCFFFFLRPFRRNRRIKKNEIRSILVCKFYGIGSQLYLSPSIKNLAAVFPNARKPFRENMKKLKRILVWYCLTLSVLLLIGLLLVHSPLISDYSEGCYMAYDSEFWRYKLAAPFEKHPIVLMGPSYVNRLKRFGGNIHNLGMPALRPTEAKNLIGSYCRGNETIFYGVNLWITFSLDWPARDVAYSTLIRHNGALKSLFFGSADLKDLAGRDATERALPREAARLTEHRIRESIDFLKKLHDQHPNVFFLLFPTQKNNVATKNIKLFQKYLIESNLPVIDLSDALSEDELSSFIHPSPEGYERLKSRLSILLPSLVDSDLQTESSE
jgi:hypothetical protein